MTRVPAWFRGVENVVRTHLLHALVSAKTRAVYCELHHTTSSFDKRVIKGRANLGGRLVLNFSNGYAPRQGETFVVLQSPNASGQFAAVEVKGPQPDF
jgi:hypothetical protein